MKLISVIVVGILLSGCVSNTYLSTNERFKGSYIEDPVYVVNPEHENFSFLINSEIYTFTNNPESKYRLTLMAPERRYICGMGLMVPFYTLGILQSSLPADELFVYEIEGPDGAYVYQHYLSMEYKTSLWQLFAKPFVSSEEKVKTKALQYSKRELYINEPL